MVVVVVKPMVVVKPIDCIHLGRPWEVFLIGLNESLEFDIPVADAAHGVNGAHDHLIHVTVLHQLGSPADNMLQTSPHLVLQRTRDVQNAAKLEQPMIHQTIDFVEEALEQRGSVLPRRRSQQIGKVEEILLPGGRLRRRAAGGHGVGGAVIHGRRRDGHRHGLRQPDGVEQGRLRLPRQILQNLGLDRVDVFD